MVEMTWNVNQPGRWRRPDVVPLLKEEDTDWKRYSLGRNMGPFDARKYLEFRLFWPYSSGIPDQWLVHQIDTVHWFTGLPHPRSCVANGGIYLWKDGRTNWDTMTAVFDYGPLDDLTKGFQVQYTSRFTNSAGGVKELYYSNGGMIDMDKQTVTPTGGLTARFAAEMKMQPNLLPSFSLLEKTEAVNTDANTHGDPETAANMRNWMECVRSRKTPNAPIEAGYSHSIALCMNVAAIQTGLKVTFDDKTQQVMAGGKVSYETRSHEGPGLRDETRRTCSDSTSILKTELGLQPPRILVMSRKEPAFSSCPPPAPDHRALAAPKGSGRSRPGQPPRRHHHRRPALHLVHLAHDSSRSRSSIPIIDADGVTITRGWPLEPRPGERTDHPHHDGLWFNYAT